MEHDHFPALSGHFQRYAKPFYSVQTASVKVGVRLGRRGHREAQPRPAGGREAEVAGQEPRHRFAGRTENPPEIVILPPAALPASAGPSGYTENSSFPYSAFWALGYRFVRRPNVL